MSNKRPGECEAAHSKRSNVVMREKQNDRMSVFAGYSSCAEQPMDLTKKSTVSKISSNATGDLTSTGTLATTRHNDAPPVINIDSEEEASDDIGREKLIRKLHEELRNEETKLIFLKQLRYNQRQQAIAALSEQTHASSHVQTPAHNNAAAHSNTAASNVAAGRPAHSSNGPAKAHGNVTVNTVQAHGSTTPAHTQSTHGRPPAHPQATSQSSAQPTKRPPPPNISTGQPIRNSGQNQHQTPHQAHQSHLQTNNTASGQVTNTPVVAGRQSTQNTPSAGATNFQQSYQQSTPAAQPTPAPPKQPVLDEAQKQAARGALRRQLEKTLLAIPPPKPLPPELSFIPSLISNDFVKLLGLEEVVKMLLDIQRQEKRDVKYVFNPFRCSQCRSDFTPVWKREKPGSKNVICEQCVTSNQKRSLRQEHTARLKGAFLKAAEQQQDLEEQLKKGHVPPSLVPLMPSALQPHSSHSSTPSMQTASSSARHQSSISSQMPAVPAHVPQLNVPAHQPVSAAAAAASVSSVLPHQLAAAAASMSASPQSLLNMAYIQQQLAAIASQPNQGLGAAYSLGSAASAVAAAAAALAPNQRQMLLDSLSQQAKSFGWKG